eukprot:TRINITY_DN101004_c0_g1_i1.p1 TRINITY_DN101004_c0_g1~~TRINITY_DN101004_c0_g1_i1.p1  ORF type:complete len:151 (-),score=25.43 TRINITY_DN101004_c0_g1_i1:278-730(-)
MTTRLLSAAFVILETASAVLDDEPVACFLQTSLERAEVESPNASLLAQNRSILAKNHSLTQSAGAVATFHDGNSSVVSETPSQPCDKILGLPKMTWAIVCDFLGICAMFLCIPFILTCTRRRSYGAPILDFSCLDGSSTVGKGNLKIPRR